MVDEVDERPATSKKTSRKSIKIDKTTTPSKKTRSESMSDSIVEKPSAKKRRQESEKSNHVYSGDAVDVHRCRFIGWTPLRIVSMASNDDGSLVAICRHGGSVEVWAVNGSSWHQVILIPQCNTGEILALNWIGHGRLFAGDLDGSIFEFDLSREERCADTSSFGGPVWCMDSNLEESRLAFGCEDGRVRLFEVVPGANNGLEYMRSFNVAASGRLLSIKWHVNADHSNIVFTGGIDGLIRKWDANTGNVLLQLSGESYGMKSGDSVCIWSLAVLQDSTVFAGDSEGFISMWNTNEDTGTQVKRFHEHQADVTNLVVSSDETCLFASGVDSRVAMFRKTENDWIYSYSHRPHSHDVRGLVLANSGNTLVSGGNDTQVCWFSISEFTKSRPCKVSPFLHTSIVHSSRERMLVQHASHMELWKFKTQQQLMVLKFKDRLGIRCSALSSDGSIVAISDDNGLKVLRVKGESTRESPLQVHRFEPIDKSVPVAMCFSGSSTLVVVSQSGLIQLIKISDKLERFASISSLIDARREGACTAIKKMSVSADGQWIACGDDTGRIFVFSVDMRQLYLELTSATFQGSLFTNFEFLPDQRSPTLVVVAMNNRCYSYMVESRQLARDPIQISLPESNETVFGLTFNDSDSVVVWCRGYACKVQLSSGETNCLTRYRPIAHMEYVATDELLVVEAPWLKIMKTFNDPLQRKKFGGAN